MKNNGYHTTDNPAYSQKELLGVTREKLIRTYYHFNTEDTYTTRILQYISDPMPVYCLTFHVCNVNPKIVLIEVRIHDRKPIIPVTLVGFIIGMGCSKNLCLSRFCMFCLIKWLKF